MLRIATLFLLLDVAEISLEALIPIWIGVLYALQSGVYLALLLFLQCTVRMSPLRDELPVRNQFLLELKLLWLNCQLPAAHQRSW